MEIEASDKPKFSVGDDGNFNFILLTPWSNNTSHSDVRNPVSYDDDDDDLSSSQRLSQMANLESCNRAVLTKKRKKPSDNSNSLHNSVKKSKVSTYDDIADNLLTWLKKETDLVEKSFEECKMKMQVEEKRLQSIKRDNKKRQKELENKKTQVSYVRKINQIYKKLQGKFEECIMEIVTMDGLIGELKKKEIELKDKEKDLDAMNKLIDVQAEKLQFERKTLLKVIEVTDDRRRAKMKEFESMKKRFEGQVKELQSKEKQCQGQVENLQSKEVKLKGRMSELESEKKDFENRMKEIETKEKQVEGREMEVALKEIQFEGQKKEFESNEEKLKGRISELESNEEKLKGRISELESNEEKLKGRMSELESNEEKLKVTSNLDGQLSRTIGGTSLQLLPSEQTDILVTLQESSDPAKVVLDKMKDDNGLTIDDWRINLLEKLMGISPNIERCVRREALKLAIEWKANMKENTENSLVVLGFLLFLSIYRLRTFFNEDEVLELFAFVSQHKIAMEMFGTLGFANKVSDFVKNLISKKQFVVAVRFSSAYNLADKKQLVDLLQKHVQNARLVFESSCKPTDSVEIKNKARNQEIASLETVQQCIADHNLESEDLLREIEYRILVQKAALDSQVI